VQTEHTLDAGGEAVMQVVHLQLAGTHCLTHTLLAALRRSQAHIRSHLHKPLLQPLLHLVHTCIGGLKLILQSGIWASLS